MTAAPTLPSPIPPLTLQGRFVRLDPLEPTHAAAFWDAAKDSLEDIFRWIPYRMQTLGDFEQVVEKPSRNNRVGNRSFLLRLKAAPERSSAARDL